MNEAIRDALREGLRESGLTTQQLYDGYRALGGLGTSDDIAQFLDGDRTLDDRQFNLLAQVINERFAQRGSDRQVSFVDADTPIIRYLDVLPLLTRATPTFELSIETTRVGAADGEYVQMMHFVRHLIRRLAAGETDGFDSTFQAVERVLDEGDEEAVQLMWFGFFDELLQPNSYAGTGRRPLDFGPWLGRRARQFPPVALALREQ